MPTVKMKNPGNAMSLGLSEGARFLFIGPGQIPISVWRRRGFSPWR